MIHSGKLASFIAPLLATFLLDESCLRYYLYFTENLKSIFDEWSIGQVGLTAYRPKTSVCSRKLTSGFAYGTTSKLWPVQITIVLRSVAETPLHFRIYQYDDNVTKEAPKVCTTAIEYNRFCGKYHSEVQAKQYRPTS